MTLSICDNSITHVIINKKCYLILELISRCVEVYSPSVHIDRYQIGKSHHKNNINCKYVMPSSIRIVNYKEIRKTL